MKKSKLSIVIACLLGLFIFTASKCSNDTYLGIQTVYAETQFQPLSTSVIKIKSFEDIRQECIQKQTEKALELSDVYINTKSNNCYEFATMFIKELKDIDDITYIQIDETEAIPGDLIFYSNNGDGLPHYAVKLNDTIAINGNVYGYTRLRDIYREQMSAPKFYRGIEKKESN